jgi:hypothetical protein
MAFLGVAYSPETIASTAISQLGLDIDGVVSGDDMSGDDSGYSVSLSSNGNRVAIATPGPYGDAGYVRIYDWNSTAWTEVGEIDGARDGAAGNVSVTSVSLSPDGSRVAIGSRDHRGNANVKGHVRIYDLASTPFTQVGSYIEGEGNKDDSGYSVSLNIDGSIVAIGARYNNAPAGASNGGHVRIFELSDGSWTQVGADIEGEAAGDESGFSVSLSSDGIRVAIGALYNDQTGDQAGHVRIYDWNSTAWIKVGDDIDGEAAGDQSGFSVSLSSDGSRVAIGARNNDDAAADAGHVRIYDWNSTAWIKVGDDIDGEAANDRSGSSVSLSPDGSRVAIGAKDNDGTGTGAGHVRIYDWNGTAWTKAGADINGEAAQDESGFSVSLSSDGSRVAIGAPGHNADAGHTRIFSLDSPALTPTFGTATKTADGLTVSITNYDSDYTFVAPTVDVDNGSVSGVVVGGTYQITVTLLDPGQSFTITQTTTKDSHFDGSATFTGSALTGAALTPTFGMATKTADGLTVSITNYDADYTFVAPTVDVDNGSVSGVVVEGTYQITVTGLTNGQSVTITQTTTRTGYFDGSATITGSALKAALTPTFGTATKTADGLTVSITNYDATAAFTFGTPTVDNGSVTAATADGSNQLLTVTGLTNGQSVTITQTTTRTGYPSGSATFTGAALLTEASIPSPYSGPLPTGVSSTEATAGDEVIISGKRLGGITSVRIDGLTVEISSQSAGSLTITIPLGLEPGLKNIRILSSDGNLTYQAALEIVALPTVEEPLPAAKPTEKLNAGSFQGLVAIYAKGYEGQKLSAKVAGKWLTVDSLGSGFERILRYTGAGYQIKIDLYINGILLQQMEVTTR